MCAADTLAQNLCQACGLCCDGTLFESVGFKAQDILPPLQLAGIGLQQTENEQYFLQPCAAHKNKSCTVYEHRPQVCQTYTCKLLRQFQKQEITWKEASLIVVETVQQRDELKSAMLNVMELPQTLSLTQMSKAFDKAQREIHGTSVIRNFSKIFLQLAVLQVRLEKFFQEKKASKS